MTGSVFCCLKISNVYGSLFFFLLCLNVVHVCMVHLCRMQRTVSSFEVCLHACFFNECERTVYYVPVCVCVCLSVLVS